MCFLSKSKFQIMTEGQFLLVIKTSVPLQAIDWDGLTESGDYAGTPYFPTV